MQADATPPVVTVQQPSEGLVTNAAQIAVTGTFSDESQTTITVSGSAATIAGNNFTATVSLSEGANNLLISVVDAAGNRSEVTRTVVRDSTPPVLTVQQPGDNTVTGNNQVVVSGTFSDSNATSVKVNDIVATLSGTNFSATVPLVEGANTLTISGVDAGNNRTDVVRNVTLDTIGPTIEVQQPANFSATNLLQTVVTGAVNDATTTAVMVNNQPATMTGNQFSGTAQLPIEGENTLVIRAVDTSGNVSQTTLYITRDTVAPAINLHSPGTA